MRRILLPTDYSETANNAFKYALRLANRQDAELYVLHVYDPPVISGHITPTLVDGVYEKYNFDELEQIESHSSILKDIQKELGIEDVKILLKVKPGLLVQEIRTAIEENDIDLIVMGTDGNSAFHKRILGTNTLNTIDKVKIPVLSVPKKAVFRKIDMMVYLTAFKDDEEKTLDLVVNDGIRRNISIKCVHLRQKGEQDDYIRNYPKWRKKYKGKPISFYNFTSEKSLFKAILGFIQKESVDLVAIAHRPRHFFEKFFSNSLTLHLAKKLEVPLLVYKRTE